jgi:hypothetical protein
LAELAVEAAVVEPFDIGERLELDVLGVAPWPSAPYQFGLEHAVEALGEGIVERLSGQSEIGAPFGPG